MPRGRPAATPDARAMAVAPACCPAQSHTYVALLHDHDRHIVTGAGAFLAAAAPGSRLSAEQAHWKAGCTAGKAPAGMLAISANSCWTKEA